MYPTLIERIETCKQLREETALTAGQILKNHPQLSEVDFREMMSQKLFRQKHFHTSGWYDPPPLGIAALFSEPNYDRLKFNTLRNETFWPHKDNVLHQESVGIIYISPVHKETGIIGDFGASFYYGKNEKINRHLNKTLALLEETVASIEVGMEFREIHEFAQKLFRDHGVNNQRTIVHNDPVGTNLGHTIPWTYEDPTVEEEKIIKGGNIDVLKNIISKKRIYVNAEEKFKIPKTIAFTLEVRLEDSNDPTMPNAYYHLIVCFIDGKKTVLKNFKPLLFSE